MEEWDVDVSSLKLELFLESISIMGLYVLCMHIFSADIFLSFFSSTSWDIVDAPYSRQHHQHQHRHQSASSSGKFGVTAAPEKYTDNHKSSREPEMKRRRHERGFALFHLSFLFSPTGFYFVKKIVFSCFVSLTSRDGVGLGILNLVSRSEFIDGRSCFWKVQAPYDSSNAIVNEIFYRQTNQIKKCIGELIRKRVGWEWIGNSSCFSRKLNCNTFHSNSETSWDTKNVNERFQRSERKKHKRKQKRTKQHGNKKRGGRDRRIKRKRWITVKTWKRNKTRKKK